MPVSVRLDRETEELLERTSKMLRTSKSEVVKKSIRQYCAPVVKVKQQNLSEVIQELILDHPGSGQGDLSTRSSEIFREILRKKHDRP